MDQPVLHQAAIGMDGCGSRGLSARARCPVLPGRMDGNWHDNTEPHLGIDRNGLHGTRAPPNVGKLLMLVAFRLVRRDDGLRKQIVLGRSIRPSLYIGRAVHSFRLVGVLVGNRARLAVDDCVFAVSPAWLPLAATGRVSLAASLIDCEEDYREVREGR